MYIKKRDGAGRSAMLPTPKPALSQKQSDVGVLKHRQGFTLVEIMIVVVIIGLLANIALPAFKKARMRTQATRFANDLRQFAGAFDTYTLETGVWPDDANEGVLPAGMVGYIDQGIFERETIYGGHYDWEGIGGGFSGGVGVAIRSSNLDDEQALLVDEILDDGVLATGRFRGDSSVYTLVLEEF
ncbi:type II secretion system protein [Cerasicoccus maritimus]|uniref:type II secretion system protein n=1 Tax=Cerasicoccus maritimus TaxID=490089 RepID=UPI0028527D1D|nr:prepilin-type N-terminal cleavage/methylation domain-containing protein [Cerasicoccus maritimus]